ncbi:MAG TPA: DUF1801 domain-containing protein [Anaerolineales bacterium]|nr:DUF1801 domain-containing protein [Anaerolineales bacterium]
MEDNRSGSPTIDEYIALFPEEIQKKLEELRTTIRAAAPQAVEKISYQMPAFYLKGNLVYFAAFKKHISFFPTSSGIQAFKQELAIYSGSKGTVRFPLDEPLPLELIGRIVKYRVAENLKKEQEKSKKRRSQEN